MVKKEINIEHFGKIQESELFKLGFNVGNILIPYTKVIVEDGINLVVATTRNVYEFALIDNDGTITYLAIKNESELKLIQEMVIAWEPNY
jgi:hypothetical protein